MIDRKVYSVLAIFGVAMFCFGQTQQAPAPTPAPTPAPAGQTTGAPPAPPAGQTTPTTPNAPELPAGQMTPPIQPKTPAVQTPPAIPLPPPPAQDPHAPNRPLTADEAAQIALHNQPNIAISQAAIRAAMGVVRQAQAGLYPTISFNQSYTKVDTFVGNGSANQGSSTTTGSTNGGTTGATTGSTNGGTNGGTTGTTSGSTSGTTGTTTGTTSGTTSGTTGTTSGTTGTTGTTSGTTGTTGTTGSVAGDNIVTTSGTRSPGFSGGVTLNQLLFDFNHTRDLVRQSQALERASRHSLTKTQLDTVLNVKQAFYTYVQNQGLVGVQEANVTSAQSALDNAQAQLNAGLGAPADVVNARTNLANAVQALVQARAVAVNSSVVLCLSMGIDPRTPIVPASSTEPPEGADDVNTLVGQALRQRPDILAAIEQVNAAGFAVSAAKTSNAPQLSFNMGVNNRGPDQPFSTDSFSAGLNLVWNFEDAGLTAGRVESARANADIAKAQLTSITQVAISDVSQAYENVKTAEERVTVASTQVQNAQENLNLAIGQYRAGVTPFVTVVTAQAQLVQAQTDQVNATAALAQTRAVLRHSIGL